VPTAEDGWLSPRRGALPTSDARRQREELQDATLQARAADVRCLLQEVSPTPVATAPEAHTGEPQRPARARRRATRGRAASRDLFR
jgi:hypothetical protein